MSEMSQTNKESPKVILNQILLSKEIDGNWKGYMLRNKVQIEVREGDPHTCLTKLITHP